MTMKKASQRKPPWKKPNPHRGTPVKLTAASKAKAKARAERAGRPYPNLVDNMWAASRQGSGVKPSKSKRVD